MNTLLIVITTLAVYSVIATLTIIITDENDYVITAFALGIIGLPFSLLCRLIQKLSVVSSIALVRDLYLKIR